MSHTWLKSERIVGLWKKTSVALCMDITKGTRSLYLDPKIRLAVSK